jgi:sugar phosphate isomerase/epimerase
MMEISSIELIETAAAASFDRVCVFVQRRKGGLDFPMITRENAREIRAALASTGIELQNIELFALTPETVVADFRPALELGASLGGRRATAVILDPDEARATSNFAAFAELCAELGIKAGLEYMAWQAVNTLADALRIVTRAGHPNGTIVIDMLHLIRNGSGPEELAGIDPALLGYVQLCDGPPTTDDYFEEAIHNRLPPGEGAFPLLQVLDCIPGDRCLSLEVPMEARRLAGMDALARAHLLHRAATALLAQRG